MHTHLQLLELLNAGVHPQVTFTKACEDWEGYPEAGMRAIATQATQFQDGCVKVTFDFAPFEAYNAQFESANYFDKGGEPTLTARQAGYYKPQEQIYMDSTGEAPEGFAIDATQVSELFARYQLEASGSVAYVTWLEGEVTRLTAGK